MNLSIKTLFTGIVLFGCFQASAEVDLVTVQPSFRQVTISGFTRARTTMFLATEVAGKIDEVFVDIGDAIPETGKFACLDDTFVEIDIESAKNDIAQHANDIRYFKKQVSRHQELVAKRSAAVSLLDDLERRLGNSQRAWKSDSLRKQRLEELRRRHCIEAPIGWRITERQVEPGQWVDAGTTVAMVGDYSHLLVPFSLSAKELAALKRNEDNLKVYLTEPELQVPAKIERISPAFDEQTHKIKVDLQLKDGLQDFRGGQRVELTLDIADKSDAFLIPKTALDERFEEFWVERKDGKKIRVSLLGYLNENIAKISSPDIILGDQFKVIQH